MSSLRSANACFACARLASSACWTRASSAASTGKRSFGVSTRGQSKRGKYWYFFGSAVLVSESV